MSKVKRIVIDIDAEELEDTDELILGAEVKKFINKLDYQIGFTVLTDYEDSIKDVNY